MLVQAYAPEGTRKTVLPDMIKQNHQVFRIDGIQTSISKCNGYCSYCQHSGYLTDELMKKHNCKSKECIYYYIKEKEEHKKNKCYIKECENTKKEEIFNHAKSFLEKYEGIAATGISGRNGKYEVRYAQICDCNEIAKQTEKYIYEITGILINMVNIKADFDTQLMAVLG